MSENRAFKIKIKVHPWDNDFQRWVKRIYLYDDKQLAKLDDWSIGFYYCELCGGIKGFAYKLPPPSEVLKEAHNDWVEFLQKHHHGDGRAILFEGKM